MTERSLSARQRAALARKIAQRRAAAPPETIPRRASDAVVPLTAPQRALWLLARIDPESVAYNAIVPLRLVGRLDVDALVVAFRWLVARHETLRTTVAVGAGGTPHAVVLPPTTEPEVHVEHAPITELEDRLRRAGRRPFALEADLPVRLIVLRHDARTHTMALVAHHIALDNLSVAVLLAELRAHYAGEPPTDEPRLQYGDYAVWQEARLASPVGEQHAAFWRDALRDLPPHLDLPTDHARPAVMTSAGGRAPLDVGVDTAAAVPPAARALGLTPYMYMLGAFAVVLHRWSGQRSFAIGTPFANRDRVEVERLVGFVNNTLAIPIRIDPNATWRETATTVRSAVVDSFAHAELPFERVVQALNPPRDVRRNPVFQVNFRLAPPLAHRIEGDTRGLTWERLSIDLEYSKFDLALEVHLGAGSITGHVEYNAALFDRGTAEAVAATFARTLETVTLDADVALLALGAPKNAPATRTPMRRRRV